MFNCIYHPTLEMRVVNDEDYERLTTSGEWFKHPNDAKNVRTDYERRIREGEKPRKYTRKRTAETVREPS